MEPPIAVALRGDRGLEQRSSFLVNDGETDCGRSSGRSRIGTTGKRKSFFDKFDCGRSSGRSRIGTPIKSPLDLWIQIAVALRGDRGLELALADAHQHRVDCGRSSGRSRIGTVWPIFEREYPHDCGRSSGRSRIGTQSAIEYVLDLDCGRSSGRSRIGTLSALILTPLNLSIAVALRGDRGLEHTDQR